MRTIYYNGQVYTGNQFEEAFIVENNTFKQVGSTKGILSYANKEDILIDLNQKFVCAGFNDSHMHVLNYGKALRSAKLNEHTTSIEDVINCMKTFIEENSIQENNWVLGRGFNHDYFSEKRMPTRHDLDKISTKHPISITRACGHNLVTNTKVLELLNIDPDTCENKDIALGIFYDDTMCMVSKCMGKPTKEEIKQMFLLAMKELNQYGVTSCHSDDYGTFKNVSFEEIHEVIQELINENKLTVRIYEQANLPTVSKYQTFVNQGFKTNVGNEFFKIGPMKIVADGSLGTRTAYMSEPYHDDPTTKGMLCYKENEIREMMQFAHKNDFQLAIHAIGDACLDILLDEFDSFIKDNKNRHGIVHCQITRKDQLDKMIQQKQHIYAQSIFLDYDIQIVHSRVGEKANTSYSWKTLLDGGCSVSNGTDCPVELPFALGGIQCAVTRNNLKETSKTYLPHESFTVKEAIDSYTKGSAYASFEENIKGQIKENYLADFIILDQNPFNIQNNQIHNIQVLETYMNGNRVYKK